MGTLIIQIITTLMLMLMKMAMIIVMITSITILIRNLVSYAINEKL